MAYFGFEANEFFLKKNLVQIPQDCIEGSLDKLLVADLLIKANKNVHCLKEARSVFKKKYGETIFRINGPFLETDENAIDKFGRKIVNVKNFNVTKTFLRAFGKVIKKLAISFNQIDVDEGKEIVKLINDKCSDLKSTSLTMLSLENCKDNVLDDLKSHFPSVDSLTFSTDLSSNFKSLSNASKLMELFPKVHNLYLGHTKLTDWEFIGKSYPHLDFLHVELSNQQDNIEENAKNLLKNNSQITTISIQKSNLNFLKEVNEILPHLKSLKLKMLSNDHINYQGDPIQFRNVKFLTIESNHNDEYPKQIHFDKIHELTLDIQPIFSAEWIEFISQQLSSSISNLILQSGMLTNEHILTLAEKLPHLKTMKIVCQSKISAYAIIGLIEKCKFLDTLQIDLLMDDFEEENLQNELRFKWDMNYRFKPGDRVKITLEKLNYDDSGTISIQSMQMMTILVCLIYALGKFF